MRIVNPNGSSRNDDDYHDDERVLEQQRSEKKGYEVFKACTENPPGVVETEDNQEDELMAPMMASPRGGLTIQQLQQRPPQPPPVWTQFSNDAGFLPHGSEAFVAPSVATSESIIDFDEFFDCASLISSYSAAAARDEARLWEDPDLEAGRNHEETENSLAHTRQGKYGGKKRRWKTGCWKKLTT